MIKLNALNAYSEEDSGSDEEVISKEALEQIALQQYAKALELQRKGNSKDATQLLRDLLDTELLDEIKTPAQGEKISGPLFKLKYLCYKNLASMLSAAGDTDAAIEAYYSASELDDTDITLWHKLGQLCLQVKRYEKALHAFQRGNEQNPRYWPCLDKIIILLLGLDYKEECIVTIHEALQLDPDYLRGLAYRRHIYKTFPFIKDYMEYLNPIYKWDEKDDEPIDEERAAKLVQEAEDINKVYLEQIQANKFKCTLPDMKLKKSISELSWNSVGESLIHMHNYITENYYSHACFIELVFNKEEKVQPMEVCEEPNVVENVDTKQEEVVSETEKKEENVPESEKTDLLDKEKAAADIEKIVTDSEKVESDIEIPNADGVLDAQLESKVQKKTPVRRRGSALSFLQQWEWCNKRRSGRKKPRQENIYDTLRKMVPEVLSPDMIQKKENQERAASPDTTDMDKLFNEADPEQTVIDQYFGTENEQKDVKEFINKYTEKRKDMIDLLKDFLSILSQKWRLKWPDGLSKIFTEANKCYKNHIDIPACLDDYREDLLHYTIVNILAEEFYVNEKLISDKTTKEEHDLSVVESIGIILSLSPHIFSGTDCLELILRYYWVKINIYILNHSEEFALDNLYNILYEFESIGEQHNTFSLHVPNFTFKPVINEADVLESIKFLERNKKLSTVKELYDKENYEEVLSIVIDSFEHCKTMANKEKDDMSLDFAVQIFLILDSYWALGKVNECFKWALICLHEALKHYFRVTSGSQEYEKWTLTVVKVLCCIEHILSTEGLSCLDSISQNELSQGLEDIIRIIGHQVETHASDMPLGTVVPWIIMHYILQREEDHGRCPPIDKDKVASDDVPNPLLILFIGHEKLGDRGWCCNSEGKLLYFILDTVVPRLRTPALAKSLEQIIQNMEQCVYCLFGHPVKKNKYKYLIEHNVNPHPLDWARAQQLYEIFKPPELPQALEGKVPGISSDVEQLFRRILDLLPTECNPEKHVPEIEKYIKGVEDKLPAVVPALPYKLKDIYYILADHYFKKEEYKSAVKFTMLDLVGNNDRMESWAVISLAKIVNTERLLNSCKNITNEREFLNPAKSIIRCFKRALDLDPSHCILWIEYGVFVYTVHSFCSRLLKQASESFSMEDFEALEKQREDMLDTTQQCFTVWNDLNRHNDVDKGNEESWLHCYLLGKVSEKRNKHPSVYMDYYMKGVKSLQETGATYPQKINYNSPTHMCFEVLELHYRIHASILKYIEQHENKPIPASVGKVFMQCIEEWKKGPFSKKNKKDNATESETDINKHKEPSFQAANILKRSVSDSGEDDTHEVKRLKLEAAAAKVRRSASYDTERLNKPPASSHEVLTIQEAPNFVAPVVEKKTDPPSQPEEDRKVEIDTKKPEETFQEKNDNVEQKKQETYTEKKEDSSTTSSSSSSTDSSSSESSSDSTSDSSRDSEVSVKSNNDSKPISEEEILKIVSGCLDALEDCTSRYPQHYKAIYRLAHYHFNSKRGKDIERCRDLMLSNFMSRSGHKLAGLFSERKSSNFFNNIWKIPISEVDRGGSFSFHMSRAVQLTMEILKEIDDHKTLLELSLQLQRIPDLDKKYLRDSDREELAQQALSFCVQSLKGQLTKFSQQADLQSNDVERQALKSLMLDIYRAYQRAQKQFTQAHNLKQFTNLLVEGYKLVATEPITESMNLTDISMKYCYKLTQKLKHEATMASLDKSQNVQKKQAAKVVEAPKPAPLPVPTTKPEYKAPPATTTTASVSGLPKISANDMAAAFQSYLPMLNDPLVSSQTAAALSYLSNVALAGYAPFPSTLQSSLQNTLQNSFQAEFYRQFLEKSLSSYMPPAKKQKRGPKPQQPQVRSMNIPIKSNPPKPYASNVSNVSKTTSALSTVPKSSSSLAPSMGTVLSSLPASMSANLTSFSGHSSHTSAHSSHTSSHSSHTSAHSLPVQAHMTSTSTVNAAIHTKPPMPHQQVSPGKTLQEKLAERQKHLPLSKTAQEINASISKLPSSLTITKTSVPKATQGKKQEAKKTLPFSVPERPKPITTDEVIVLDDD